MPPNKAQNKNRQLHGSIWTPLDHLSVKNQASEIHGTIYLWNPYDETNNMILFSEKSEHVSIFDPLGNL